MTFIYRPYPNIWDEAKNTTGHFWGVSGGLGRFHGVLGAFQKISVGFQRLFRHIQGSPRFLGKLQSVLGVSSGPQKALVRFRRGMRGVSVNFDKVAEGFMRSQTVLGRFAAFQRVSWGFWSFLVLS